MTDIQLYKGAAPLTYNHSSSETCAVDIHLHDVYEIFQALSPNIRYFVEGNAYRLNTGDIIITTDRELHRPVTLDDGLYQRRFLQFQPSIIPLYVDLAYSPLSFFEKRLPGTSNHLPMTDQTLLIVNPTFDAIEAAFRSGDEHRLYEARQMLTELLITLEKLYSSVSSDDSKTQPIDDRIRQVLADLDRNFCHAFHLESFSRTHMMDKFYLSHLFKENTGFTLIEYLQSKRIQKSKYLLSTTQNISEIARECGYDDYSNFFKTFKKIVGTSPKAYRARLTNQQTP